MTKRSNRGLITAPMLGGVERLWRNKNRLINGVDVAPSLFIAGVDISGGTSWTDRISGKAYAIVGAGTNPTSGEEAPALGDKGSAVANGQKFWGVGAGDGYCDVTTEDMLVAALYFRPAGGAASSVIFAKLTAGGAGFQVGSFSNLFRLYIQDGSSNICYVRCTDAEGQWNFCVAGINKSESQADGLHATNWAVATGILRNNNPSGVGSITTADRNAIGENNPGIANSTGDFTLAMAAVWKQASWFTDGAGAAGTHAEVEAAAKEMSSLLLGHQALHNHGALTPSTL